MDEGGETVARSSRSKSVWRMAAWAVLALLIVGGGVLVSKRAPMEEAPLALRTIGWAGKTGPGFAAVTTEAELERAWAQLPQAPPVPQVDWDREWVVAAFMGERPTGGYRITMDEARVAGREVRIRVTTREPGPTDVVTMVITYPAHWAAVERPGRPGDYDVIWYDDEGHVLAAMEVTF